MLSWCWLELAMSERETLPVASTPLVVEFDTSSYQLLQDPTTHYLKGALQITQYLIRLFVICEKVSTASEWRNLVVLTSVLEAHPRKTTLTLVQCKKALPC
jgi:hypothetical protein